MDSQFANFPKFFLISPIFPASIVQSLYNKYHYASKTIIKIITRTKSIDKKIGDSSYPCLIFHKTFHKTDFQLTDPAKLKTIKKEEQRQVPWELLAKYFHQQHRPANLQLHILACSRQTNESL